MFELLLCWARDSIRQIWLTPERIMQLHLQMAPFKLLRQGPHSCSRSPCSPGTPCQTAQRPHEQTCPPPWFTGVTLGLACWARHEAVSWPAAVDQPTRHKSWRTQTQELENVFLRYHWNRVGMSSLPASPCQPAGAGLAGPASTTHQLYASQPSQVQSAQQWLI